MLRNRAVLPRLDYLLAFEVAAELESFSADWRQGPVAVSAAGARDVSVATGDGVGSETQPVSASRANAARRRLLMKGCGDRSGRGMLNPPRVGAVPGSRSG